VSAVFVLARLAVAVVFVISAVAKLRDRTGSRDAVRAFGLPHALVGPIAAGLPIFELVCAALLVTADPAATLGGAGSLLLLAAFTVAMVVNLAQGRRPDCHCFGSMRGGAIGWNTVGRNAGLLALAGLSLGGAGAAGSVPAELADYSGEQLLTGGLVALAGGVVAILGGALYTLMGRYGTVLLRLEALETATGLAAPKPAPSFELPDLDGALVRSDDLLGARPLLVVFVSHTCVLCEALLPDLERWQQDPEHAVQVVVISTGSAEANRVKAAEAGPTVLLQRDDEVARSFEVQGTPAAFLLGADGLFAAPAAYGVEAARALHDRTLRTVSSGHQHTHDQLHQIERRPVAAGDPLPDITVDTESDGLVPLADLVHDGAVLLFWRTDCGYCSVIADQVVPLQDAARIVVVSGSALPELRGQGLVGPVARDVGGKLMESLQVPGTPAAVRVRAGLTDSNLAVGGPAVLSLLSAGADVASQDTGAQ